jgi:hypothetical protein
MLNEAWATENLLLGILLMLGGTLPFSVTMALLLLIGINTEPFPDVSDPVFHQAEIVGGFGDASDGYGQKYSLYPSPFFDHPG